MGGSRIPGYSTGGSEMPLRLPDTDEGGDGPISFCRSRRERRRRIKNNWLSELSALELWEEAVEENEPS